MFLQSGSFIATAWKDKRIVYYLSTACQATGNDTIIRKGKGGEAITLPAPPSAKLYEKQMGGVDRANQLRHYNTIKKRQVKWWTQIVWYLFSTALTNAYILYKNDQKNPISHFQFTNNVANQLINGWTSRKRAGRPKQTSYTNSIPSVIDHYPVKK